MSPWLPAGLNSEASARMWTGGRTPSPTIITGLLHCSPEVLSHCPAGRKCVLSQEYFMGNWWILYWFDFHQIIVFFFFFIRGARAARMFLCFLSKNTVSQCENCFFFNSTSWRFCRFHMWNVAHIVRSCIISGNAEFYQLILTWSTRSISANKMAFTNQRPIVLHRR